MGLAGFYFGIVNSYIHFSIFFYMFYLDLLFVKQLRLVLTLEFSIIGILYILVNDLSHLIFHSFVP